MISSLLLQSSQFPFTLVDYTVTQKMNREMVTMFTNEMSQPPLAYNAAYQRALQLFDGHEILERQEERRYVAKRAQDKMKDSQPLSVLIENVVEDSQGGGSFGNDYLNDEERETLHGCQILLQMIQNCDAVLQKARCIQIHEMLLSQYVLPILSNQFDSLDDQTSRTLEAYFAAYGPTMQYYVAHNTRQLLLYGESMTATKNNPDDNDDTVALSSSSSPPPRYYHVPKTKRLQEFGLELLLQQQIQVVVNDDTTRTSTTSIPRIAHENNTPIHNSINDDTIATTHSSISGTGSSGIMSVNVFDTVMVGMATIDEVLDTMRIVQSYEQKNAGKHTNQ
jgi:hypothetical protein